MKYGIFSKKVTYTLKIFMNLKHCGTQLKPDNKAVFFPLDSLINHGESKWSFILISLRKPLDYCALIFVTQWVNNSKANFTFDLKPLKAKSCDL